MSLRPLLALILTMMVFLSGCVRYDVGIDFQNQHYGQIVQTITLAQQLTRLSQLEVKQWVSSLENRAKKLGGSLQRISPETVKVIIPFGNGQQLASKFNQFYHQEPTLKATSVDNLELLNLDAQLSIKQTNFLFIERNLLRFTIDLRGLGVISQEGNIILSSGSLLDLNLNLESPLKTQVVGQNASAVVKGNNLIWHLKPGQINTLEVFCWVPSYLAIGGLVIVFLLFGGYYLKYKRLPGTATAT